uniref:NUT family member 2G-like n=1 Tax=Canis lupus dingo TaxID=286419 RepID=A0A8C0QX42_CANLU
MATGGAFPVLRPHVATDMGAFASPFPSQPFPAPRHGIPHRSSWALPPPPLLNLPFPASGPLELPSFPSIPLVAGDAGHGPGGPGTCNVIVQVGSEQGSLEPLQTQNIVLTQAPPTWNSAGTLCGGAACPTPVFLAASVMVPGVPASAFGGSQVGQGISAPGPLAAALPPAAPLSALEHFVNTGPPPPGAGREGSGASNPSTASSPKDSCNPRSVYENFRRWQRFKSLARRHLPQSPDAEALSCFLIPVLRTLARLKPTMTLEEGVWWAVQEWQSKSNFDRLIYYEMAGNPGPGQGQGVPELGPVGPPHLPSWIPPSPALDSPLLPPAGLGMGGDPKFPMVGLPARERGGGAAHPPPPPPRRPPKALLEPRRPRDNKAPKEIPPEAVREYMDIMDGLLGPALSAPGGPVAERGEDGKEPQWDGDPGLLSYIDQLCSQEDFITKVEAVIHPTFLAELLSSETQLDLQALAEKLEQEEGLSLAELVEKRLAALKVEAGVRTPPHHCTAGWGSGPECEAGAQLGAGGGACAPETAGQEPQRHSRAHTHLSRPRAFAGSPRRPEPPAPWASPPQGQRGASLGPSSRGAPVLRESPPSRDPGGPVVGSSEDEELPSLAFLLALQHSLLPWEFSQSPTPDRHLPSPARRRTPSPQRRGLGPAAPLAPKSWKRALWGGPDPAGKTPLPGAHLRGSGQPAKAKAVRPLHPSQPPKRRCDPFPMGSRRKRHCSQ